MQKYRREVMTNPFSLTKNKYYNGYSDYIGQKYGQRVQKVTVDAGFTCPNRDGTVALGGCTYCNNESFNPSYNSAVKSIHQQIDEGILFLRHRYKVDKYIVYFQPYSNTYASLDRLKQLYETALSFPGVVGLTIGTRPDCIDAGKIAYLEELGREYDITIEYGLESVYDESLRKVNRGHDFRAYRDALDMTAGRGISICTHIIIGFPWETKQMWLDEIDLLSGLPFDFLKIHQLHIVRDTVMEKQYQRGDFELLSYQDYLDTIVSLIERLNPEKIVQRLFGEAPPSVMVAPRWGKRNSDMLDAIYAEFERRDTWQGKRYSHANFQRAAEKLLQTA